MAIKNLMPFGRKDVPVRREEENPFRALRREMDSLFENFFHGFEMEPFTSRHGAFSPDIDVVESDKEIAVTVELPGMDEKDIDVSLNEDTLTIRGEKKAEKEDKGKDFYRMERSYGSFSRSITLPKEVNTEKVEAQFKKGILTVVLPKTSKAVEETRKISIKSE